MDEAGEQFLFSPALFAHTYEMGKCPCNLLLVEVAHRHIDADVAASHPTDLWARPPVFIRVATTFSIV